VEEFKEFRLQKAIIKTIKFKAEVIKADDEAGRVMNAVCTALTFRKNQSV
jgi:hypothetical protein